jgi:hypothetical protein
VWIGFLDQLIQCNAKFCRIKNNKRHANSKRPGEKMEKKGLIDQFEKDLYEYAQSFIESRQKNYNSYLENGDELAEAFFYIFEQRGSRSKDSYSLLYYFYPQIIY